MPVVDDKIAKTEQIIGYTFHDKLLCAEALQMDGWPSRMILDGKVVSIEKNTRLAVLGDAIMAVCLCEKWHKHRDHQGKSLSKETWTNLRKSLSNEELGKLGVVHGLETTINTNPGSTYVSSAMIATTIEAICGAAYVDAGENGADTVRSIMHCLGLFNHPSLTARHISP